MAAPTRTVGMCGESVLVAVTRLSSSKQRSYSQNNQADIGSCWVLQMEYHHKLHQSCIVFHFMTKTVFMQLMLFTSFELSIFMHGSAVGFLAFVLIYTFRLIFSLY